MHYLIVPGLNNSGPTHWQSYWVNSLCGKGVTASRVYQHNWHSPQKSEWIKVLDDTIAQIHTPVFLVTHSLGSVTAVLWLLKKQQENALPHTIKGAFLVAPADADKVDLIKNFGPMPTEKLPVPSCVVASENDPYMTLERSRFFANTWGSTFINAGSLGHINADSNLGEWLQGRIFLAEFEQSFK